MLKRGWGNIFPRKKRDENQKFLNCNFFLKNNKGQITVFVIAAIVIVAMVGLYFSFRSGVLPSIGGGNKEANVNEFFTSCIEDKISEAAREISLVGGDLKPKLYVRFLFTEENIARNISYICYTQNNFLPCVVQKPTLFLDVQNEIKNYISQDVESCFSEMKSSFGKQGFVVSQDSKLNGFDVELMPEKISVKTDSKIILTKSDETKTQEDFEISVLSDTYGLVGIAQEIVNSETQFCYFEDTGFEVAYPDYSITKHLIESGNKIYTITNKKTDEIFRFAIRGCAIPPGF